MDPTQNIPELVSKLQIGDHDSFCQLFLLFGPKIYHTSRKMNLTHEDAEEVVQEVFLKIWNKRTHLDHTLSFNAYLLSILKSFIYNKTKKQLKEAAYQNYLAPRQETVSNGGEEILSIREMRDLSTKMLAQLPQGQKQIIELKYLHQMSAEEIAIQLNLSKRTVEHQLYKAKKAIKERLNKEKLIPLDLLSSLVLSR